MPESQSHIDFVKKLGEVAVQILNESQLPFLYLDDPLSEAKPPRTSGNFVPDMFFKDQNLMMIGEAKTAEDVDRKHSLSQYENYFDDLFSFNGRSVIVFSVPWYTKNTIKNIARRLRLKRKTTIEIYVITEIGDAEKLWATLNTFTIQTSN